MVRSSLVPIKNRSFVKPPTMGSAPAVDENCNAKTVVQYYYKSTDPQLSPSTQTLASTQRAPGQLDPGFKAYDLAGPRPADVAQIVTSGGQKVSYIVRRE